MQRSTLASEIATARELLLDTLSALPDESWQAPSLCADWAVRDVVGHLVHEHALYRAPYPRAGMRRINEYLSVEARRVASGLTNPELLTALARAEFERTIFWRITPWPEFALTELVVHGQDIRRPLNVPDKPPVSQLLLAADVFVGKARRNPFRSAFMPTLPAVRFEATDCDWSHGSGPIVRGPIEAIVLALDGRIPALDDLPGDGIEPLKSALA